jgi:hypothetical protein
MVLDMNETNNTSSTIPRASKRAVRERVKAKREARIKAQQERERTITRLAVDVAVNREAALDHERAAAAAVAKLRDVGETQQAIAELCEISTNDVKTLLALAGEETNEKEDK